MKLQKNFFHLVALLLTASFIINQLGRITIGQAAITLLDIVVGIVSVGWFIYQRKRLVDIFWRNKLGKAWIYFVIAALFSIIIKFVSLPSIAIYLALLYLLRWMCYSSIMFLVYMLPKDYKQKIPAYLLFTGVSIIVLGFIQYVFYPSLKNLFYLGWDEHMFRMFSVFLDPNFAAAFFMLFSFFLMGNVIRLPILKKFSEKIVYKISLVFAVLCLALTISRSAYIATLIAVGVLLVLEKKLKLILPVLIGAMLFVLIISPYFYLENVNLFRQVSSRERIQSAQEALQILVENPIVGVGFGAYKYALVKHGFREANPPIVSHADNSTDMSLLFVLATTGVIGGFLYLNFWKEVVSVVFRKVHGRYTINSIIGIASLVGIFIDSLFINSLFFPPLVLWVGVIVGLNDYK